MLPLRCFTFKPLLLAKTFITIYNNTSSSDKSISCCLSHQHPATYLFRAVLTCKRCLICADFLPDQTRSLFHWRKHYYGLFCPETTTKCLNDEFVTTLIDLWDINWWTGVVWIIVMFHQMFGLSFWRHPFTAEHPLLRHWCRDTFLQTWWRNKLILISYGLSMSTFSANVIFWWTIPLICNTDILVYIHFLFTTVMFFLIWSAKTVCLFQWDLPAE